jgi:hypothetical protein
MAIKKEKLTMKIYFIFLCLFISGGFANATIQNTVNQDKPTYFYVESYNLSDNGSSTRNYTVSYTSTESVNFNGNADWSDGSGGAGSWIFSDEYTFDTYYQELDSDNADLYWLPGSWPDITSIINETGSTLETPYYYSGGTSSSTNQPAQFNLEHCDINVNSNLYSSIDSGSPYYEQVTRQYIERRSAQTTLRLRTGGKALSSIRNLFCLTGSATNLNPNDTLSVDRFTGRYVYMFEQSAGNNIASQNITIGSYGKLDSSGNVYVALPDNADVDVTPYVAGAGYYDFNVSQYQYAFVITANSNVLSTITPEFCVGQQVTFSNYFNPPIPNNIVASAVIKWVFTGNYVNNYTPGSSGSSANYFVDPSLLNNGISSAWWVSGGASPPATYTAALGENLTLNNGQQVIVLANGQFNMYKPTVSNFQTYPPYYAALVPTTNSPNELQLGGNGGIGNAGAMAYNLTVNSIAPFGGGANIVQLVNASRSLSASYGGEQSTTSGQYWLDTDGFYFNGDSSIFSPLYYNSMEFLDQPGYGLNNLTGADLCSIVDSFKDYIVFKPGGNNSIYVTLGRVLWSWSASTSKTNGVWSSPTYQVNGPSSPDGSDEFPSWPNTYSGSR